jgi:Protein of unknown function (DUF3105)
VEHRNLTEQRQPSTPRGPKPPPTTTSSRRPSTSPTGTRRSGRRETTRRHYEQQSALQRYRTPIIAIGVIVVAVLVGAFVFTSAASPTYACTTIDTVQASASGEIGQVQPDMGNTHVLRGEKVTYPVCPPASGKHVNQSPNGPIPPKFYGPDDTAIPNGWIHNLEHGALVLLYSCDKGACDASSQEALKAFYTGFPASAVCQIPPGTLSPVVARFEQMPTRYAALVWDRVFYFDDFDAAKVYDFFNRYAERVDNDGKWVAPPEPQCNPPSPSASVEAVPSTGASPSVEANPSPAASPAVEPQPSPSPS